MKLKSVYTKGIISLALIAIIGLQFLWLFKMHQSYHIANSMLINQKINHAIELDLSRRQHASEGHLIYALIMPKMEEEYREFKIERADTTYSFTYQTSKFDMSSANQLVLKIFNPINVHVLDTIFYNLLSAEEMELKHTVIEYYDKDTDSIIRSGTLKNDIFLQQYETDWIYLDLIDSIAVKAYVQTSYFYIFRQMLLQLILSVILLFAVVFCLFRLSKTIFQQQKIDKVKQDFVNAMTHELKRPIATSVLTLEHLTMLIELNKTDKIGEHVDDALFSLKKLNLYVEKIQEISKGEEGKLNYEKETVPLQPFFEKLKRKYELTQNKVVSLNVNIEPDIAINTDILHFSNIAENLIENSIKYSGDSVIIDITATKKNNNIQIVHRDNGWGISEEDLPYIFDKFYRSNSSAKRKKSGFGLGLSYVKIVVENTGGTITVKSEEKEYTEFTLTFPMMHT